MWRCPFFPGAILNEEPVISEELQGLLNVDFGPEVYEIEKGALKRFAEAIEDPNPRWLREAPPTFCAALAPSGLLHRLFNARTRLTRLLNGASELEYFSLLWPGTSLPSRAG